MMDLPLVVVYSLASVSNLTVPVRSTSNRRKATSYSPSGLDNRFSNVAQSLSVNFPVCRRSATLNRIPYCSRLIFFYIVESVKEQNLLWTLCPPNTHTHTHTHIVFMLGHNGVDKLIFCHVQLAGGFILESVTEEVLLDLGG